MSRNLESEQPGSGRDSEERSSQCHAAAVRDKMMDKTLADSFPTSDPPSSIPDPTSDSFDAEEAIASPYDRLTHADTEDAEHQPQRGEGEKEKAA